MGKFIGLLFILFIFSSCSNDSERVTNDLKTTEFISLTNLTYGTNRDQAYNIYLPKGRNLDTKIILLIHGGGWTSGDKNEMNAFKDFVRQEFPEVAVVNMNYRLADNNNSPYPMQLDDITLLVNELGAKQNEYQIGTQLGLIGASAGGHLSLLWSYARDVRDQVKLVCSIVGPTNLLDNAYQNSTDPILQELIGLFGDDQKLLEEASPLYQVKSSSPPTLLFYGGQDPLIPISQGYDLDARLTELEVQHEFTLYENEGHGWFGINLFDTSFKLKEFITKNLL
jgi:acetyl esterase/lipase